MNEDQDYIKELEKDFPEMFKRVQCGVSYGPGWHDLIYKLSKYIYGFREYGVHVKLAQIKEKFGTLRYYTDTEFKPHKTWDEKSQQHYLNSIEGAISFAEYLSGTICEDCGAPGKSRPGGWILTLCDTCHAEQKKDKGFTDRLNRQREKLKESRKNE